MKLIQKIAAFGIFISFASCVTKNDDPLLTREQAMVERGTDVELIYSDSAQVRVKVMGKTMLYSIRPTAKQEFTEGVKVIFYDLLMNEQGVLTGKYAVRDETKRKTIIKDDVVWTSTIDGKLETSELEWDEASNIISSTKFVKITQTGQQIFGYGFQTNSQLSQWQIKVPTGKLQVENLEGQF
ncbi:MAG: hypothetical protein RL757_1698 [Bacteroidota bacterium]|jgi:hypothetical protein